MAEKSKKMNWKEIIEKYPDEWVELVNFDEDENGYLINDIVICHNKDKKSFTKESIKAREEGNYNSVAFRYTGQYTPIRVWE